MKLTKTLVPGTNVFLEDYLDIKEAGLITLGSKVSTIATVIVPIYAMICLIFQPILYRYTKRWK